MKPGAELVHLDPAAPCAGRVFERADVAYFVTHPCHPPVFNDETDLEAKRDFFGGVKARQHIVCALLQGSEVDYERGVALCRALFHPVIQAHRITVEQMAILSPRAGDDLGPGGDDQGGPGRGHPPRGAGCGRRPSDGPHQHPAGDHVREVDARYSDGALKMLAEAQSVLFKPDWKKVFEPEAVRAHLDSILKPPTA
jgi:hypothetical protein